MTPFKNIIHIVFVYNNCHMKLGVHLDVWFWQLIYVETTAIIISLNLHPDAVYSLCP